MKTFKQYLTEAPQNPLKLLFHKDLGIPDILARPKPGMRLHHRRHARIGADDDGVTNIPDRLPDQFEVIEIEVTAGRVSKWLVRFSYDAQNDIVMPILPDGFIKTVWLNDKHDTHRTLKRHLYTDPKTIKLTPKKP